MRRLNRTHTAACVVEVECGVKGDEGERVFRQFCGYAVLRELANDW